MTLSRCTCGHLEISHFRGHALLGRVCWVCPCRAFTPPVIHGTPVIKTWARDYDARRDRVLPPEGGRFVEADGTVVDVTVRER